MEIDGAGRKSELATNALSRVEVVGKPSSEVVFACVDAIWEQDPRIRELISGKLDESWPGR
jgi:hypothetical protein